MNIGFDVDGVIVNTEDMFRAYAEIFDIEKFGKDTLNNPNDYYVQRRYSWDEDSVKEFLNSAFIECSKTCSLVAGVDIVINKLKELNHNLVVISARGKDSEEMISVIEDKFKTHNINFNKIYWKIDDKLEICKKENIDIMIDDRPETCLTLSQNKIHAFYFRGNDRPILEDNEYLTTVTNWGEIYKKIILMNQNKN